MGRETNVAHLTASAMMLKEKTPNESNLHE